MTTYPILTFTQSFVKIQNMDTKIQMKDDVLEHIFIYATFVRPLRLTLWKGKMTAYHKSIFLQILIRFQSMVPEIQMKRDKRDIYTYVRIYIIYNDQPSHRISISWLNTGIFFLISFSLLFQNMFHICTFSYKIIIKYNFLVESF